MYSHHVNDKLIKVPIFSELNGGRIQGGKGAWTTPAPVSRSS